MLDWIKKEEWYWINENIKTENEFMIDLNWVGCHVHLQIKVKSKINASNILGVWINNRKRVI